MSTTAPC